MLGKLLVGIRPFAPVILRLGVGAAFIFHGCQSLFGIWDGPGIAGVQEGLEHMGFYPPVLWAYLLACTYFFGGIALVLGALTSYAAFAIAIAMTVAFVMAHHASFLPPPGSPKGTPGGEMAFAYLVACISLIFSGSGPLALDNFLRAPVSASGKLTSSKGEPVGGKKPDKPKT